MKKSRIISEFREFISRGNVIDLAVGIIVGSAFTAIVNSLVNDLLMPVLGYIIGGINFDSLRLVLRPAVEGVSEEVAVNFGSFLERAVDFLLISVVVFMLVKLMNRFRRKNEQLKEQQQAKPSEEVLLLTEIRDLLKK